MLGAEADALPVEVMEAVAGFFHLNLNTNFAQVTASPFSLVWCPANTCT